MKIGLTYLLLLFLLGTAVACKKDKVPVPEPPPEPNKWEVIAGHYKVCDTKGLFQQVFTISCMMAWYETEAYRKRIKWPGCDQ